jgi:outer membrane murein-binding lipoprotein Lpp
VLKFQGGAGADCTVTKGADSGGTAYLQHSCGASFKKGFFTSQISVPGHTNLLNYINQINSKVTTLQSEVASLKTKVTAAEESSDIAANAAKNALTQTELDQTQSDLTKLTFDLTADIWCAAKSNFAGNTHAVKVSSNGIRTGNQWCAHASKDIYYQGIKRTWSCLAGSTRIAPDYGQQYTHIGQSYGGPHKGNWASFYWAQSCGGTANNNGNTYVCCKG